MSQKSRVFIDAGSIAEPNRSGVGHVAYRTLLSLLADKDFIEQYEVVLVVSFNKAHLVEKEIRDKVRVRRIFIPGRIFNGLVRFNLLPWMDIWLGRGIYVFFNFKNWPLLFSRSVTYVHDVYYNIAPEHIEPRNLDLLKRNLPKYIRRSDRVVTVSRHAKSEIEKYYPYSKGKVDVVYNGIDRTIYYPRSKSEQEKVAHAYGIVQGNYFMFLSNIEPRKNIGPLLEAFKQYVDESKSDASLLLVGGMGWGNEHILSRMCELQSKGYSIVKPSQYVPDEDLPALLSGAICLVHPALYEGFGITPLEALSCGTDIIIGNNSSLPEVVGSNYKDYVDITDPSDISRRMKELTARKKKNIAISPELAARPALFSWDKAAKGLMAVLDQLGYN